jgi:acetyl esterase/lipase
MIHLRFAIALLLAAAALTEPALAEPTRPPAASFFQPPEISRVVVSPTGEWIAQLRKNSAGRQMLVVAETAKPSQQRALASFTDADVDGVWWVNERRLVYAASQPGLFIREGGRGVFAVDVDGERPRQIIAWLDDPRATGTNIPTRMLNFEWEFAGTIGDGSDDVLVRRYPRTAAGDVMVGELARVDSTSAVLRSLSIGAPMPAAETLLDGKGTLRIVQIVRGGKARLLWRAPGSDEWKVIDERDELDRRTLRPVALESDNELIVETRIDGDTSSLHSFKLAERKLDPEPIISIKGYDVGDGVKRAGPLGRVIGVHTLAAQPVSAWFETHLAQAQSAVDKALPAGRSNRLVCERCEPGTRLVVRSESDTEPGEWFIFDPKARSLVKLGSERPALADVPQGRRTAHRVAARDGLSMPVWVTHPAGAAPQGPLPTVLLVHGGPWIRGGSLLWSAEAQFFASRGWRVIEPEFRGSTGFGDTHFRAGFKQWGLAMQDDLADALAWAVKERLTDPKKVCIYGTSYGGYAALMGPIRHPQLYRCAASLVGVTDIELMYTATWADLTRDLRRFTMPVLVGDPQRDAAQLAETSPLKRAAEIRVPVLLGQGWEDTRVPREHADKFERAAKAAGVPIERVNYYDEAHGFSLLKHRVDWMNRLEAFFGKAFAD